MLKSSVSPLEVVFLCSCFFLIVLFSFSVPAWSFGVFLQSFLPLCGHFMFLSLGALHPFEDARAEVAFTGPTGSNQ